MATIKDPVYTNSLSIDRDEAAALLQMILSTIATIELDISRYGIDVVDDVTMKNLLLSFRMLDKIDENWRELYMRISLTA